MSLQIKPPEKKNDSSPSPSPPSSCPSFSSLPEELAVNCLVWIPRSYYPRLSIVSKSFRSLLSSTELYTARSHLGSTEHCLYVSLWDYNFQSPAWFRLWINPNRTLLNSSLTKKKKKTIGQLLVPITSSTFLPQSESTIAVGSETYTFGRALDQARSSTVLVLDCRSHTWREAPSMNVARTMAVTCVYEGKILGGFGVFEDEPWGEVFDRKTQTWECLPDPGTEVRKLEFPKIEEIEGKIYVGEDENLYAYDTRQGKWESCENESTTFSWPDCVMENVCYSYYCLSDSVSIWWYDIKDGAWEMVEGLESLEEKHMKDHRSRDNYTSKIVSCGGKLVIFWEERMEHNKKIWYAEIVVEKRDGGELWGKIEWVDVVRTVPESCRLKHCLVASV